ncbi:NAD-dependent epimerase/dehydratase family protein [Chlorogloeopsis sp. ULAP01]|uniref:NAD-dependent epimerase/dehydratase family protein n=1 Tax=Chlorogloeopsis sp. ULAP01 TaxID=3056483 RepID=UPI0025AB29A7|nr:NAD-dependent epimerase/dehydratase family protein [Chlorogloeopsis sp. ULAP01]MDM9385794.1 NAD-dependent epimerase/dehydratase family protein [Chlorogloeopsis sp. ULAP01]
MNLKDKTILITGIGGFIGLRTTELAIAQGMYVKGIENDPTNAKIAQSLGAEVIVGSVCDPVVAQQACQGVDIILHTAALVKEGGSLEEFRKVNVGGTLNIARAAIDAGVKTFIHLSSVIVYGFTYANKITEEGPFRSEDNPYSLTKIESEQEILKLNAPPNFGVIIIRPTAVYGPRSSPWVIRPLKLMRQKRFVMPDAGRGVMNHVYIDNLIDGIFLAIEKEAYGEAFNISDGQETSWKEYYTRLAEVGNVPAPSSLPAPIVKILIRLESLRMKFLGQEPVIFPAAVDFSTSPHAYSLEKAQTQLGYKPKVTLEEGMEHIRQWLETTDIQI